MNLAPATCNFRVTGRTGVVRCDRPEGSPVHLGHLAFADDGGRKLLLLGVVVRTNHRDFDRVASGFDRAVWNVKHTVLLDDLARELETAGEDIKMQDQNRFRYERPSGLVVAGVPDLVSTSTTFTVFDCKAGKPRISDQVQVMLYMYMLPLCSQEYQDQPLDGCVVYSSTRIRIPAQAVDEEFAESVGHFIDVLESRSPARRLPSESECKFCDITSADCSARI